MKNLKISDFAVGCITLAAIAAACVLLFSAQTLLLIAGFAAASMLVLFLWSRKSRVAKAAAIALMAALLVAYVVPKVLEAARASLPKDIKPARSAS